MSDHSRMPLYGAELSAAVVKALDALAERVAPTTLVARHGLPSVITQALDDVALPPAARLLMWHLRLRLDLTVFREQKAESLAREMRIKETTVGQMLRLLVVQGYLEEHGKRKPRAFRFPWSRRTTRERAA